MTKRTVIVNGIVDLHWDNAHEMWVLDAPIRVRWAKPTGPRFDFTVPIGFRTDLSSIPRWARSIIPQVGRQNRASIPHDWACAGNVPGMSRTQANLMFLDIMRLDGVGRWRRAVMFAAVQARATRLSAQRWLKGGS